MRGGRFRGIEPLGNPLVAFGRGVGVEGETREESTVAVKSADRRIELLTEQGISSKA